MRRLITKWSGAAAVIVFLTGTAAVLTHGLRRADGQPANPGYTMMSRIVFYPDGGGSPVLRALRVRYQSRSGAFREVTTNLRSGGSASAGVMFSVPGKGTFTTTHGGDTLNFLSPALPAGAHYSEAATRRSSAFRGEDRLAGYRALKVHYGTGPSNSRDLWLAPDLGGAVLQAWLRSGPGVLKQEPALVVAGEPDRFLVLQEVDSPVSFAGFQRRINKLEGSGSHDEAAKLRRALDIARPLVPAVAGDQPQEPDACKK